MTGRIQCMYLNIASEASTQKWGQGKMEKVPLVPPYIESLRPYEAGRTIERSAAVRPRARRQARLQRESAGRVAQGHPGHDTRAPGLNLYPNGGLDLREVLAREFDVKVENVIAGSGSKAS